jgi:hypothetical protein
MHVAVQLMPADPVQLALLLQAGKGAASAEELERGSE